MKLGTESAKKTYLALGLFVVALIMVVRFISSEFGGSGPAPANTAAAARPEPARPARRGARTGTHAKNDKSAGPVTPALDPRLDLAGLKEAEDTKYDGTGRNIFMATEEPKIPPPVATGFKTGGHQATVTPPTPPLPPPHPAPPPINLKFFGFASGPDHKRVFLSSGDDVVVASEGEIVQRRYKIVKINDKSIDVLDVLSNNKQTIPLTAG